MSEFHDVLFPIHLAFGASGGPVRATTILPLASGGEFRNSAHRHSKRKYNAVAGLKSPPEAHELIEFFEARQGPLHPFRFRDPLDHTSKNYDSSLAGFDGVVNASDQILGYGDGISQEFFLKKSYGQAPHIYVRPITKPVLGSVLVAVNGQAISDVTINYLTGATTFLVAPPLGAVITAGFEFDVAVRFADEAMDIVLDDFGAMQIPDVPLIEVLGI